MQSPGHEITQATGVGWLSVDVRELIPPRFGQFERINNLFVAATSKSEYFSIEGEKLAHLQWPLIVDFGNG